ncbi:MAG: recombinase family protein [Eubacteriales bacterium]|nr:recombinase family protein [Eubacteriales bacterium]
MKTNVPGRAHAALYIRVSTGRQEELSPDAQRRLLLDYAAANQMTVAPEHVFTENGISGRKAERRPEFQRMICLAKSEAHPFDAILVWKFSRFARNQEESIVYKSMLKKQYDIDVISITEPLTEGPFGSLIERIIEWMDEYYSINLSGEVLRGMTEKAMRGGCQTSPPLGYRSLGNGRPFAVVPEEAQIVSFIFEQYTLYRRDATAIARSLNECGLHTKRGGPFERRSVIYILRNPFYTGKIVWNGIEREGVHETFISRRLFEDANQRLDAELSLQARRSPSPRRHWLSGLVKCSACGASLGYNKGKYPFFQCWKYARGVHPKSCGISEKILTFAVQEYLELLLKDCPISLSRHPLPHPPVNESAYIQRDLDKLNAGEERLRRAYEAGIDTLEEYKTRKARLSSERARLSDALSLLDTAASDSDGTKKEDALCQIKTIQDLIKSDLADSELKGTFLRALLEDILWDKEANTLSFRLRKSL